MKGITALAIRGSCTRLSGVDQLDFDTRGIDVSLSKGFTVVTPYVGVGAYFNWDFIGWIINAL